jgi:MFS family permease
MPRGRYYGWRLVWGLGLTTIISYGTTQYLFGVLVVPVQAETGWSRGAISGAYSLSYLFAGVLGIVIGRVVDRSGARALMTAGSAIGGLSLVALGSAHALWQFYLLWAGGLGLAMALTFYSVTFTVITNWFVRRRGSALAWLTLLGGLASPLFIPLAGALIPRLGWRGTVVVLGLTQLFIALPIHAVILRRRPEDLGLAPDGDAVRGGERLLSGDLLSTALRRTAFWTLTVSSALSLLAGATLGAHQIAYMIGRGYDPVLAATLAGMVGLASLPGRYLFNLLSERLRPQDLLALCGAIQVLGVVVLLFASSVAWLLAFAVIYGLPFGAISPLRASALADHFGRRAYGAILAAQGVPIAVAGAAGPLLAGLLYDRLHTYQLAFWLTAGAFGLAALTVAVTPKPRPRSVV